MADATTTATVTKSDRSVSPTRFDVTTFQKPEPGERMAFEVNVVAESGDGMKKRARVEPNLPTWSSFTIECDEGSMIGGNDTAPPPLGYLSAGAAFCLLTHLTGLIHDRQLEVDELRVEQRASFFTEVFPGGNDPADHDSGCAGFETHVVVESSESEEAIAQLLQDAQDACMAMSAIMQETPSDLHMHLNGEEI